MRETKFETLDWNSVYELLLELAGKIKRSYFEPDIIIGVSRGGWIPARILSDLLNNPYLANIKVEFYSDINKRMKTPIITQSVSLSVTDRQILIVDDIVDTGETLHLVYDELSKEAKQTKTAVLYYKPWSSIKPDYHLKNTDAWIIFPWELSEMTKNLCHSMLKKGKNLKNVEEKLSRIGLNPSLVKKLLTICLFEESE